MMAVMCFLANKFEHDGSCDADAHGWLVVFTPLSVAANAMGVWLAGYLQS